MPVETPNWLLLVIATSLGLSVDIFSDTLGMHTSATIFMAFCRPGLLRLIAPRDGYEVNSNPSIQQFSLVWFIGYATILTFLHHTFLFIVEVFRFSEILSTLGRSLSSTFFSLILIIITQFFKYNSEARK
jgi:hypothetical protein